MQDYLEKAMTMDEDIHNGFCWIMESNSSCAELQTAVRADVELEQKLEIEKQEADAELRME